MGEPAEDVLSELRAIRSLLERLVGSEATPRRRPRQTVESLDHAREIALRKIRRKGGVDR